MVLPEWGFDGFLEDRLRIVLVMVLFEWFIFLLMVEFAWMAWDTALRLKYVIFGVIKVIWKNMFIEFGIVFVLYVLGVMNDGAILEGIEIGLDFALFLINFHTAGFVITHLVLNT